MGDSVDRAVVALRDFVHLSGALRAQALVEHEPGAAPAIVSCTRLGPIEVVVDDREAHLPHDVQLAVDAPELGEIRRLPPFEVDPARAEVAGVIGGVDHAADAVSRLAAALGGRSTAVVELETTTPDLPLVLSARAGEPVVVTLGSDSYEL